MMTKLYVIDEITRFDGTEQLSELGGQWHSPCIPLVLLAHFLSDIVAPYPYHWGRFDLYAHFYV
jgi:hypothetical protein